MARYQPIIIIIIISAHVTWQLLTVPALKRSILDGQAFPVTAVRAWNSLLPAVVILVHTVILLEP